jgi:hypothetical protein
MFKTAGIMISGFNYQLIQPIIQFPIAFSYNRMKQVIRKLKINLLRL